MNWGRIVDALLAIAATFCAATIVTGLLAYDAPASLQDPPAPILLTFSNLPPKWVVEITTNLTDWLPSMMSCEVPPQSLTFTLTNTDQAQFLRVRELP